MKTELHFIKSDYCQECDGTGSVPHGFTVGFDPKKMELFDIDKFEQCEECERLHKDEIYADRMHDMAKGN